eukprot:2863175-Karenia_brevis.AAC.1
MISEVHAEINSDEARSRNHKASESDHTSICMEKLKEKSKLEIICLWKSEKEMETESTGNESVHKQHLDRECR